MRVEAPDQLGTRVDVQLAIDPRQVEFDRLGAEEERFGGLPVRPALGHLQRDRPAARACTSK